MKTRPPAVTSGPPRFGTPTVHGIGSGEMSRTVPSGTCHTIVPRARSTAASVPHGGGLQGIPSGESSVQRCIA